MNKAYIGLGSNIGNAAANIHTAIDELSKISKVCACSSLYLTKPWGYLDQPDFINAVVAIEVKGNPHQLLVSLKEIEKSMSRQDPNIRWGPRLIDLDILTFENLQLSESDLIIPHPFMFERAFVLAPLAEIDDSFQPAYLKLSDELRQQVKRITSC